MHKITMHRNKLKLKTFPLYISVNTNLGQLYFLHMSIICHYFKVPLSNMNFVAMYTYVHFYREKYSIL